VTPVLAHIGKVPVEEWLPFVVPVVAVWVWSRYKTRREQATLPPTEKQRRRAAQGRVALVLAHWRAAGHDELGESHVPLLAPPGPQGCNAAELAARTGVSEPETRELLEELDEVGVIELLPAEDSDRVWLTPLGEDLVDVAAHALAEPLPAAALRPAPQPARDGSGVPGSR
jgi:hypothetical protein